MIGLFFQDESMKLNFSCYPELLFMDATYKLNELRIPVYILLVEDSLGLSEVVGVALLVNETKESISWLINSFAKNNETKNLRTVMADKDINERNRISEILHVPTLICLFHALKSFKRELAALKLNAKLRDEAKTLFQKMCFANTKEDFISLEKQFLALDSSPLVEYYKEHWQPISCEWVKCFKAQKGHFLNSTNNRLESFNGKLKSVIGFKSSLEEFVRGFFVVLESLRTERNQVVANEFLKVRPFTTEDKNIKAIRNHLTVYAADYVCEELAALKQSKVQQSTITACDCCFATSMRLPCRHIFLSRFQAKCEDLFVEDLCDERWSKAYCQKSHRLFNGSHLSSALGNKLSCSTTSKRPVKDLNHNERYRNTAGICSKLSSLAAEVGGETFNARINTLKMLQSIWEKGGEARILSMGKIVLSDSLLDIN